ncbi:MAG: hypothetical protein WCX97_00445 [Candidatus Magasanikbacteria bacterium]
MARGSRTPTAWARKRQRKKKARDKRRAGGKIGLGMPPSPFFGW